MNPKDGARLLKMACRVALKEDRVGALMRRVISSAECGDVDAAIELAKQVLATNSRYADAAIIEGVLLMHEKGRSVLAGRSFTHAVAQDPNNALALCYVALDHVSRGKTPVAVALLDAAVKVEPIDSFAAFTLGWILKTVGNTGGAGALFKEEYRGGWWKLACSTLASLIVGPGEDGAEPTGPRRGRRNMRCLLDLAGVPTERLAAEHLVPLGHGLTDGEACDHVVNPAMEAYRQRFGERVAGHYEKHVFRTIVRPEVEAEVRRLGLAHLLSQDKSAGAPQGMVEVPGGEYRLGCSQGKTDYPERKVSLPTFYIDRYPVTNRQWREFRPEHAFPKGQEDHPVVSVDFLQATLYARWRGKRLPTEEEWEAAARGPDGRSYPWRATPHPSMANCAELKRKARVAVTAHPKGVSPCGAMDMMGNVQEWVNTWVMHPSGRQQLRVVKGGGFTLPLANMFCWHRSSVLPLTSHQVVGFRCAK